MGRGRLKACTKLLFKAAYLFCRDFGMVECPKCGGQMREGVVFLSGLGFPAAGVGLPSARALPGMGVQMTTDDTTKWREKTGQKTGLFRGNEEKTMEILGHRCIICGYIELYARE
ncbi:hypothetical protein MUP77_02720 [Candidatus Bathyarchaeota archaeon]|nr:hypothetical protein [Candidatus Bathyarchaeota archaeon]